MPIHEYVCRACGREFEELIRSAADKVVCPKCGSADLERKLSTFAAVVSAGEPACHDAASCPRGSCCSGGACHMDD